MIVFQPRPLVIVYLVLWGVFFFGETVLALRRRARQGVAQEDRGFLSRVWLVFLLSNFLAVACLRLFPGATFGTYITSCAGIGLMAVGLLLRWWSIAYLGRFFTVDVAVVPDQHVIDSGPYRLIRHPSYTGALLALLGVGVCFGNLFSMLVLLLPYVGFLLRRMRIEEAALSAGLGDPYRAYMTRTKRLIPGIY